MSYWKRISESLPEDGEDIIFRDINGFNHKGYYDGNDGNFWEDVGTGYEHYEVVAWCYVPEYDLED